MPSLAPDDFAWLPATEQLAALAAGELSSAELVELYLSRISTHNGSLNAIVTVDADGLRSTRPRRPCADARRRGSNIAGAPATTMPVATTAAGLPVGIQAMGPPGGDRTTVEFAAVLAEVLGGYRIPPQYRSSVTSTA